MNSYYLKNVEQIKDVFEEEGVVSLFDFLTEDEFELLQKKIQKIELRHEKNILTHSYAKADVPLFLFSNNTIELLETITTKKLTKATLLQFKHKDYTILNDATLQKEDIDIVFNLSDWQEEWGGSIFYVNNTGQYTQIPNNANCLTLKRRENNEQWFVKFVNCRSKGKKSFLILS